MLPYEKEVNENFSSNLKQHLISKKLVKIDNKVYEPWIYPKPQGALIKMLIYLISLFLIIYSMVIVITELMLMLPQYTLIY